VTVRSEPAAPSVWEGRNFRIAWAGGLINDAGDWVLIVALPVYVFTETGSGTATALLFVCQLIVAAVLGPLGGSLVDRWDLRRCLIATNLAQAVMLLPLFAVSSTRVWPAYVAITGQAALSQLNNPANVALLPRLVRSDQLTAANAAQSASSSLARLVGSPLGGALVAVGGLHAVVLIDIASYLAVALAMRFISADTTPPDDAAEMPRGVRAGFQAMRSRPPLPAVLAIHGLSQLAQGAFIVLFVVFVVDRLGRDGTAVGAIRGTMALGAIVGAVVIGRVGSRADPLRLLAVGYVGMGVIALTFWNTPQVTMALWAYVVLFSLSGIPGAALTVGLFTTLQTTAPAAILGRVVGVLLAAEAVGAAVGSILAGLLVDHLPLTTLLNAQAAMYLGCGMLVAALTWRRRAAPVPHGGALFGSSTIVDGADLSTTPPSAPDTSTM
jgi:predicted MFS family arabinose efflux permease